MPARRWRCSRAGGWTCPSSSSRATPASLGKIGSKIGEELDDARAAAQRIRALVGDLRVWSRGGESAERGNAGNASSDVNATMESTLRIAWNGIRHRARLVKQLGVV